MTMSHSQTSINYLAMYLSNRRLGYIAPAFAETMVDLPLGRHLGFCSRTAEAAPRAERPMLSQSSSTVRFAKVVAG
jgi:hypothetical protein